MQNEPTPATPSQAYEFMAPKWARINAVLGGLDTMRANKSLLPQHERESSSNYAERLQRARMVNWSEITLDSLVGRPFSDPLKVSDAAVAKLGADVLNNIDLVGNDLNTFAREVFRTGIAKSFCHILVEFPRVANKETRSLADDRAENLRPYLVRINPENVIFAETEIVNGQEVLKHVRIWEEHCERVGWEEVITQRIRVLEPGTGEVFELRKGTGNGEPVWTSIEQYTYDLDFIPMVTYYAERDGVMIGKPPLLDLVDLNIAHWQSSADQVQVLTVARFPILAASGLGDDDKLEIGPKNLIRIADPQGKLYYVEHTGAAIASGQIDLDTLEKQMAGYGAQFLLRRPGRETATARALDSAEATTPLADMTVRFINAMERVLKSMLAWQGDFKTSTEGWIILPTDFGPESIDSADLHTLDNARSRGDISRKTYLAELRRRALLADDFSEEEDRIWIQDEDASGMTVGVTDDDEGEDDDLLRSGN